MDMAKVVVVATTPVDPDTLVDHVDPNDELVVVVPAVEQSRLDWLANDEGRARASAQAVGEIVAAEAPTDDASDVEVKPDAPEQVVRDAVAEHHPDRIVAVVRRGEDASWLEDGDRIPEAIDGVPVALVELDS